MQGIDHADFLASLGAIRAEVEQHVGALPRYRALTAIERALEEFHGLDDVATPLTELGESLRVRLNETAEYRAWNAIRSIGPELTTVLDFLAQRGSDHVSQRHDEPAGDVYWSVSGTPACDAELRSVISADEAQMALPSDAGHDALETASDDAKPEAVAARSDDDIEIAVIVTSGEGADALSGTTLNNARDFSPDDGVSTREAPSGEASRHDGSDDWQMKSNALPDTTSAADPFVTPPSQASEFASTRSERPPPSFAESLSQRMAQALVSTPREASQADERLQGGNHRVEGTDAESVHEATQPSKTGRAA